MHERQEETAKALTDDVLLAALRRAVLHDPRGRGHVPIWVLLEHLDVPRRSAGASAARERLARLEERGWIDRGSAHGVPMWTLGKAGTRRLRRVERSGASIALPESPQHRSWRRARALASQEIDRFAAELERACEEAAALLESERREEVRSDAWLELGARLARDCRLLASARHCLSEWPEPTEARADLDALSAPDDHLLEHDRLRALRVLRAGRRNTLLWRERE
jgi:hypothetical protein